MSALTLSQSKTALGPGLTASFLASGGTSPYSYSLRSGGAGGSVNSSTGIYTAPASVPTNPSQINDIVIATDSDGLVANASILIGNPLLLFCEIIQREMGLAQNRVYLWQQKLFQPTDSGPYVAVSIESCKPFSNILRPAIIAGQADWSQSVHVTNFYSLLGIDIISRDISAVYRKEEVLLALNGIYSRQQQEGNSFYIGKIPTQFNDLSQIDGAAIPYRFHISVAIQYAVSMTTNSRYISDFSAGVEEYYSP